MKQFIQDDKAYGNLFFIIATMVIAVLISGVMTNVLTVGVNTVIDINNDNVDAGITSLQTSNNIEFAKNVFTGLGLLTLLGSFLWAKLHSNSQNQIVDATLFIGSVGVMYIFSFLSMVLVLAFGMTLDTLFIVFNDAGVYDNIPVAWQGVPDGSIAVSIVYVLCHIFTFIGIFAFFMGVVRKSFGESVQYDEYQTQAVD